MKGTFLKKFAAKRRTKKNQNTDDTDDGTVLTGPMNWASYVVKWGCRQRSVETCDGTSLGHGERSAGNRLNFCLPISLHVPVTFATSYAPYEENGKFSLV